MRLVTAVRLLLIAITLVGLVAGRGAVAIVAPAHAAMTVGTAAHDCCDRAAGAPVERVFPAGDCQGVACPMTAPAVFLFAPVVAVAPVRAVLAPQAVQPLSGRAPPPPLEPPRA